MSWTNPRFDYHGASVLVTGGSSGIGSVGSGGEDCFASPLGAGSGLAERVGSAAGSGVTAGFRCGAGFAAGSAGGAAAAAESAVGGDSSSIVGTCDAGGETGVAASSAFTGTTPEPGQRRHCVR